MSKKGGGIPRQNNPHLKKNVSIDVTHSSVDSIPIREDQTDVIVQSLNLAPFKTKKCSLNEDHNHKRCPYYHNALDKKRPGEFYSQDLCKRIRDTKYCPIGDNCEYAHNRVEQLYREDKYKTKFCTSFLDKSVECDYGDFCSFAHTENEVKTDLIHNYVYDTDFYIFHYKTVWCPFNLTSHDKALCVYAHNWQDFRRRPDVYSYDPEPCPNWKSEDFIGDYNQGCYYSFDCRKCHGWKELEFHPFTYKVKPCKADRCNKEGHCSLFHNEKEKRSIDSRIIHKLMKFQPKNRNIKNTYKYNKGSREGGSMSKSLSRDEPQERVINQQPIRSNKGGKRRNDDLLKRSLKTNQLKAMQASEPKEKRSRKYQSGYNQYPENNEIFRDLESAHNQGNYPSYPTSARIQNERGHQYGYDPQYIQTESIDQGGGHYAPAPTYKSRFKGIDPHAFYAERLQHITPRNGPGLIISTNNRMQLLQANLGDKRSRSVHLEERTNAEGIALQSSKFKTKNELMSRGSGSDWYEGQHSSGHLQDAREGNLMPNNPSINQETHNSEETGIHQYNMQRPAPSSPSRFEMKRAGVSKQLDQNESRLILPRNPRRLSKQSCRRLGLLLILN